MHPDVSIFTCLHGQASKKISARVTSSDNNNVCMEFAVVGQTYTAFLSPGSILHNQIVLFDGFIPVDGLPGGALLLSYRYAPHDDADPREYDLPKRTLLRENNDTVKQSEKYVVPICDYTERIVSPVIGTTFVSVHRELLAIPMGHTALCYRIRPRSLARQYTAIESSDTRVLFRTIVK